MKKTLFFIFALFTMCNIWAQNSWEEIELPDSVSIQQIHCLNKNIVFGWDKMEKIIYKTEDGGYTWKIVLNGSKHDKKLYPVKMSFINPNVGFLIMNNVLLKTTDSGNHWSEIIQTPLYGDGDLVRLLAIDENNIWILENSKEYFWRSTDGGKNFEKIGEFGYLTEIGFSGDMGYIIDVKANVYVSYDKGKTWIYVTRLINEGEGGESGDFYQIINDLFVHSFSTATYGGRRHLIQTENGFQTFTKLSYPNEFPTNSTSRKISFSDSKNGMLFGIYNELYLIELYYTNDGGKTWEKDLEFNFNNDISFYDIDSKEGVWYVTIKHDSDGKHFLYKTDKQLDIQSSEIPSITVKNPVTDNLMIECGDKTVKQIEMYDITGRLVFFQNTPNQNMVNINHLRTGIYFLKILVDDQLFNTKILKQ